MDVPAGLLDDDLDLSPDKHVYVDLKASWMSISDNLTQYTGAQFRELRKLVD